MTVVASTLTSLALGGAALLGVAFAVVLIVLSLKNRPEPEPDIPPAMKPGPSDEVLERRNLERVMGWGVVFVLFFATWVPVMWLVEPNQNVTDEVQLAERRVERGEKWFAEFGEENPTGFGCARCHGPEGTGGQTIPFTNADGDVVDVQPPPLADVCGRLTIENVVDTDTGVVAKGIRQTIMEGRPNTPMPSWSIRFAGPMNDQQIQDLIDYLLSIQTVEGDANLCLNPPSPADDKADPADKNEPPADPS